MNKTTQREYKCWRCCCENFGLQISTGYVKSCSGHFLYTLQIQSYIDT